MLAHGQTHSADIVAMDGPSGESKRCQSTILAGRWCTAMLRFSDSSHASAVRRNFIIAESTGCSDPALLEALYEHYAQPEAWNVSPDAAATLTSISAAGASTSCYHDLDDPMPCHMRCLEQM